MANTSQFAEELRQLTVIDQKASALLTADALLYAGVALSSADSSLQGQLVLVLIHVVELALLVSAFLALMSSKMMPKFSYWPLHDKDFDEAGYAEARERIGGIVRRRRKFLDACWIGTISSTALIGLYALSKLLQAIGI